MPTRGGKKSAKGTKDRASVRSLVHVVNTHTYVSVSTTNLCVVNRWDIFVVSQWHQIGRVILKIPFSPVKKFSAVQQL